MTRYLPVRMLTALNLFMCMNVRGQGVMQAVKIAAPQSSGAPSWDPAKIPSGINKPVASAPGHHSLAGRQKPPNYTSFTEIRVNKSAEAIAANTGYEQHPELGLLFPGAPCGNCYELLSERTQNTKTFVKEGTINGKKQKMTQTSTQPMHYKDAAGNWRTVITHLQADAVNKGIYTIAEEATPITINTNAGNTFCSLGKDGESIKFNRNLELVYVQPDGKEVNLGTANYTHHTAGDQGMYVTNAWPGIDIEMNVLHGAIKTNFHINHALPGYAGGKLLIRDHLLLDKGLSLYAQGRSEFTGELQIQDKYGSPVYGIGAANVCQQNNYKNTQPLAYSIGSNNTLDISLPGLYLNKAAGAYPIIIDPLVTIATSTNPLGSSFNGSYPPPPPGCAYTNAAYTPADCAISDIGFAFSYTTVSPMPIDSGGFYFYLGTCMNPYDPLAALLGIPDVWTCDSTGPGTCGTDVSISMYADVDTCLPAPSCTSIPLNITMYFLQSYAPTAACATTWCYGSAPLVITVSGETVGLDSDAAAISASPATICNGASSTLSGSGVYGIPPYTYTWAPVGGVNSSATVTPSVTTTYTLTVTDACGATATGAVTVTVNPDPVLSILSFTDPTTCQGADGSITLHDAASPGGTSYSVSYVYNGASYTASLTSDGSGNIIISGLSSGSYTNISVVTAAGCTSNTVGPVTLTDPPPPSVPVLGANTPLCAGQTLFLTASDTISRGTYTWTLPDGTTATTQNLTIPNITESDSGIFTLSYDFANCTGTVSINVPVYSPQPLTGLTPNTTIAYGSSIQLNAGGALYYWWSPDNGSLSNPDINNPVASPPTTTVYTVVGATAYGCIDTGYVTIGIDTATAVFIPTAFTPNGDGLNDVFKIGNLKNMQLVDFSIFNRWGQLVYHNTYNANQGWDGTFNGVAQDTGVYNYTVTLSYPEGGTQSFKGSVTLIR